MVGKTEKMLFSLYFINTIGRVHFYVTDNWGVYFLCDGISWVLATILIIQSRHSYLKWLGMILPNYVLLLSIFANEGNYFTGIAVTWLMTFGLLSFLYRKTHVVYLSLSILWLTAGNLYDELTGHAVGFEYADISRLIVFGIIMYIGHDSRTKRVSQQGN